MPPDPNASSVASLDDLTDLFASLGYDGQLEHVLAPPPGTVRAALVARHSAFRVTGIEVRGDPHAAATRFVETMASETERGMVAALSPARARLAIGTWNAERQPVVRPLGLRAPDARSLDLLERLRPRPSESALALHLRVAAVLATEGVGDRFVRALRRVLDRFTAECPLAMPRADARVIAFSALTRVLFLYFVQAKGWLSGERDYLRRRLDQALSDRRSFHRDVLQPLMFGALCTPAARRSRQDALGPVPFLNGGLFDPTALEERRGTPQWPNAVWRAAFDDLFDRFQFSVRETGRDVAVEPDMLGRVFEGVMEAPRRRASGTFYTPHALVADLLDRALVPLLAGRADVKRHAVREALAGCKPTEPEAAALLEAVRHLTLLDPAAGSGAFLLGALERLETLHQTLLGPHAPPPHRLRRRLLRYNLFGVDSDLVAVRLAELRLWLAVIADDPVADPAAVAPLPNLDGVVRHGDSLVDPVTLATAGAGPATARDVRRQVARVAEARIALFATVGPAKRRVAQTLRQSELALARGVLQNVIDRTDRGIETLLSDARRPTLFGTRAGLEADGRRLLRSLRQRRRAARAAHRQLRDANAVPFFAFECHWPDVLAAGGFDLVVGNPPWVRGERVPPAVRHVLRSRYQTYRASGRGFAHAPDLCQAFVERALELTAPNGAVAFLVPSKLATAGYAGPLRALLARETTVECVRPLGDTNTFRAAVYPTALIVMKTPPSAAQRERLATGPWVQLRRGEQALKDALRGTGRCVAELSPPRLGLKTGLNEVFLGRFLDGSFTALSGAVGVIDPLHVRPALRGRDVAPFLIEPRLELLWTHDHDGRPHLRLPADLSAYLAPFAERLRRRTDARQQPWWALFRTIGASPVPRTVWRDLSSTLSASALAAGSPTIPLNTCYVTLHENDEDALALAALLNSSALRWLARVEADEARGGYRRYNARTVGSLPIPERGSTWADLAAFARSAHARPNAIDQDELDDLVASAFHLAATARSELVRVAHDLR
jgi:hypothetical protein